MKWLLMSVALLAQTVDRSRPPLVTSSTDGFTVRRLPGPVVSDGRAWIEAEPIIGVQSVRAANGGFTITLSAPNDQGDVERYRVQFTAAGGRAIALTDQFVSYVFVTRDSRWIFLEPLDAIDVRAWRRYNLSAAFGIQAYVSIRAVSADGRRLIVSRSDCAIDCRSIPDQYYEITIPAD